MASASGAIEGISMIENIQRHQQSQRTASRENETEGNQSSASGRRVSGAETWRNLGVKINNQPKKAQRKREAPTAEEISIAKHLNSIKQSAEMA